MKKILVYFIIIISIQAQNKVNFKSKLLEKEKEYLQKVIAEFSNLDLNSLLIPCLERMLVINPKGKEYYEWLIKSYIEMGQYKRAEKLCYDTLKFLGEEIIIWKLLAYSYINQNKLGDAEDILYALYLLDKLELKDIKVLSDIALKNNHYDLAIELYQKLLKKNAKDKETAFKLFIAYWRSGNYENAEEIAIKIQSPFWKKLYLAWGEMELERKRFNIALSIYKKALKKFPLDYNILYGTALAYFYSDRFAESEKILKILILSKNFKIKAYKLISLIKIKEKDFKSAESYLKKARNLDPSNIEILSILIDVERKIFLEKLGSTKL